MEYSKYGLQGFFSLLRIMEEGCQVDKVALRNGVSNNREGSILGIKYYLKENLKINYKISRARNILLIFRVAVC